MKVKVYEYKNCSTCQKALKYLTARGIPFEKVPIVETPPSKTELKRMLGHLKERGGSFRHLFNTSGAVYRELGVAERIKAGMSEDEALDLLTKNGKLIKRPFLLTSEGGEVGFNETAWTRLLG